VVPVVQGLVSRMDIRNISLGGEGAARCHRKPQPDLRLVVLCWGGGSRGLPSLRPRLGEVGWRRAAGRGLARALVMVVVVPTLGGAEVVMGDCPCL